MFLCSSSAVHDISSIKRKLRHGGFREFDSSDKEILNEIESSPHFVDYVDSTGTTLLMWAIKKERMKVLLKVLECGVDVNRPDYDGYAPLHYAVKTGNSRICQLLLNRGADMRACCGSDYTTPLHLACQHNMLDIVQLLVACGANRNVVVDSKVPEDYLSEPFDAFAECVKEYCHSSILDDSYKCAISVTSVSPSTL